MPAVPAAWSVTTSAFIVRLPVPIVSSEGPSFCVADYRGQVIHERSYSVTGQQAMTNTDLGTPAAAPVGRPPVQWREVVAFSALAYALAGRGGHRWSGPTCVGS